MSRVFADAAFYIALLNPRDQLHADAVGVRAELEEFGITEVVTSESVLVEVLTFMSRFGPQSRSRASDLVDQLRRDPATHVTPLGPELFESGLRLYRARLDKSYSMTDCMSMALCRTRRIQQVLTHDHDFEQEGFHILL